MSGWRTAHPDDLPEILRIADQVHPDHPEDAAVLGERLALYPPGCLLLERDRQAQGYAISHPWHGPQPPALNRCLFRLPAHPDRYLVHDLALLPSCRGGGQGRLAMERLDAAARQAGLHEMSLVAIGGSDRFWMAMGFRPLRGPEAAAQEASGYGAAAVAMSRTLSRDTGHGASQDGCDLFTR